MSAPAIIIEPTSAGLVAVRIKPALSHRQLERAFPAAWQAGDWAELISSEFGWRVIDRSGALA
jgi:hypothetical protein